jgi:hypothetical protein
MAENGTMSSAARVLLTNESDKAVPWRNFGKCYDDITLAEFIQRLPAL